MRASHPPESLAELRRSRAAIRSQLETEALPMLEDWFRHAIRDHQVEAACAVRAHMAVVFRPLSAAQLERRSVVTLLSSWVFLTTNYDGFRRIEPAAVAAAAQRRANAKSKELTAAALDAAAAAHLQLHLPPLDALALFHQHRAGALAWRRSASSTARSSWSCAATKRTPKLYS